MNKLIIVTFILLAVGCTKQNKSLKVSYIKGGKTLTDNIVFNKFLTEDGRIQTDYLTQVSFEVIDSAYFLHNKPDKSRFFSESVELDFSKKVEEYSPEYYSIATTYYIDKATDGH